MPFACDSKAPRPARERSHARALRWLGPLLLASAAGAVALGCAPQERTGEHAALREQFAGHAALVLEGSGTFVEDARGFSPEAKGARDSLRGLSIVLPGRAEE